MPSRHQSRMISLLREQKGMAAIHMAMLGTILVAIAAFAVDVGHALVTQNELQNAADSAALAAGRQLGVTYLGLTQPEQADLSRDLTGAEQTQITGQATTAAFANKASDVTNLLLSQADIEFGTWDMNAHTFTPTVTRPTAMRVTARRDGGANGPITTFFAGIVGVQTMDVTATAVAALGTAGGPAAPGSVDAPFGISEDWFTGPRVCGDTITFSPTGTQGGCAGWHQFDEQTGGGNNSPGNCNGGGGGGGGGGAGPGQGGANAHMMDQVIECLEAGNYQSPAIYPGQTQFEFTGGEVASAWPELESLYDSKKDGNGNWYVSVPVYEQNGCMNVSGPTTIVGYANVKVTTVQPPQGNGDGLIAAELSCDTYFNSAPSANPLGGGGATTPLSPFPRLVS